MKIIRITATPVSIPTIRPCAWSLGKGYGFSRTLVQIETDTGHIGLGETSGASAANVINSHFANKLLGLAIEERREAQRRCLNNHNDFGQLSDPTKAAAFVAVEMALWDLLGKQQGQPLYKLLGGQCRERAPFGGYAYTVDLDEGHRLDQVPELMAELAVQSVEKTGCRLFEFKVGRHGVECDIETILAVRKAIGQRIAIGVDANMAYSMDEARYLLKHSAFALDSIEEPVSTLSGMQKLRQDFGVPMSTHCTAIETMRHYPDIDASVGDVHVDGGIAGTIRTAHQINALGKRFWLRSCLESGISWAAMCHLGIALPELDRPGQTLINWMEHDLIKGERWTVKEGGVIPPELPGLGVELDEQALDYYHKLYLEKGEMDYFEEV